MSRSNDFEKSISELEKIVSLLESGDITLDESIKLFERGTELAGECTKTLETAKLKIITLTEAEEENEQEL